MVENILQYDYDNCDWCDYQALLTVIWVRTRLTSAPYPTSCWAFTSRWARDVVIRCGVSTRHEIVVESLRAASFALNVEGA